MSSIDKHVCMISLAFLLFSLILFYLKGMFFTICSYIVVNLQKIYGYYNYNVDTGLDYNSKTEYNSSVGK